MTLKVEKNMKTRRHPGEYIQRVYMEPLNITAVDLAEHLDISPSTLSRILNKKIDLTYEMAIRLSTVLGRSPESWVNLQTEYSLCIAEKKLNKEKLKPIFNACEELEDELDFA